MNKLRLLLAALLLLTLAGCGRPCTPATSGIYKGCCVVSGTGDWYCEE